MIGNCFCILMFVFINECTNRESGLKGVCGLRSKFLRNAKHNCEKLSATNVFSNCLCNVVSKIYITSCLGDGCVLCPCFL